MADLTGILGIARQKQLTAIQRTERTLDVSTLRLATGRKVNSALDNPQNFFASRSLQFRSKDLNRLLDGIGQNIQAIKVADTGLRAIERLLNQADALVKEIQQTFPEEGILQPGEVRAGAVTGLQALIMADSPDAYWRLNETGGTAAINYGTGGAALNGTYQNGVSLGEDPLYTLQGTSSAGFNGTNQFVDIPDSNLINLTNHNRRTVELTFNANDVNTRQVLYEEGAGVNALSIYIDGGRVYVNGRDQGAWGPVNISAEIEVDTTYHVAFVYDRPNQEFRGYFNGENIGTVAIPNVAFPSHSGDIGIGAMNETTWFHDGSEGGTGRYFNGRISDVALYNDTLVDADMEARYAAIAANEVEGLIEEYENVMNQIDLVVRDSGYRGRNLLDGDTIRTFFNERRTSYIDSEGQNFSSGALRLGSRPFIDPADLDDTLDLIREGLEDVRNYASTLANDLSIISARENFTQSLINTLEEGSDSLILADQNEEGAKLLALQTRRTIQMSVLSAPQASIANFLA